MQPYYNGYQSYQPYQMPYNQRQPQGYPNYQYQPQAPTTAPMTAPNTATQHIVAYVNGIEGAKGYILFPNQTAILFDSDDKDKFYIKYSDANAVPTLERYIKIKEDATATDIKMNFVSQQEFDELKKVVETLKENKQ